jgi:hypothetical protein
MPTYTRLYLVPVSGVQQVIDVDSSDLVLSNGTFVPVQVAPSVTLIGATYDSSFTPFSYTPVPEGGLNLSQAQQQELRVCWREPVGTDDYPNEQTVVAADPSGGICVCGITCNGQDLAYAVVQNVTT